MAIAAEAHFSCRHGMVHTLFLPACKSIHTSIHIQHTAVAPMRARPEDRRRAVKAEDGGEARRGEAEEMCGLHSLRCLPCPPACLVPPWLTGQEGGNQQKRSERAGPALRATASLTHAHAHLALPCFASPSSQLSFFSACYSALFRRYPTCHTSTLRLQTVWKKSRSKSALKRFTSMAW